MPAEPMGLVLSCPAFCAETQIPRRHTADGLDLSPALAWSGAPAGTRSFAVVVEDPDAPGGTRPWVHWVLYDVPGARQGLPEGIVRARNLEDGAKQGTNDFGRIGYGGPAPPAGRTHRYFIRLYALDAALRLGPGARAADLKATLSAHLLDRAERFGRYGRPAG